MRLCFKIFIFSYSFSLLFISCNQKAESPRIFEGYHQYLDEIIISKKGAFRGIDLNNNSAFIKKTEKVAPIESSAEQLYFEYVLDSAMNYSIQYSLNNDSLEEISLQINSNDLELVSYLFCDLKDFYANKLPNPIEDKGHVVYNGNEGSAKPYNISLSDNSSTSKGVINMVIYRDK